MSLKGKKFTADDLGHGDRRRFAGKPKALEEHLSALNERYRIVAKSQDGVPYIAEELQERALRTLSPAVRVLATQALFQLTAEQRLELQAAFDSKGELIIPFERV